MAARGLAFLPKASVKQEDTESGDTRPGLTSAKLAVIAQAVGIVAGFMAVVCEFLPYRIVGYTTMDSETGASFWPNSITLWSERLALAPACAGTLVAVVALMALALRGRARWLRYLQIGLWLLVLASSVYIADACAAFTGLGVLYGPLVVGDVPVTITIVLLALSLRRPTGRRPRWHLALVPLAIGVGVLAPAVPLVTASWDPPYGPSSGTLAGNVGPCSPAEQKAAGGLDTSRVVTVTVQNYAGQTVASQRLPFRASGARYRMRLPTGTYTISVTTTAGNSSGDMLYIPANKTLEVDWDDPNDACVL